MAVFGGGGDVDAERRKDVVPRVDCEKVAPFGKRREAEGVVAADGEVVANARRAGEDGVGGGWKGRRVGEQRRRGDGNGKLGGGGESSGEDEREGGMEEHHGDCGVGQGKTRSNCSERCQRDGTGAAAFRPTCLDGLHLV